MPIPSIRPRILDRVVFFLSAASVLGIAGWVAWRLLFFTKSAQFDFPLGPDPTLWGKAALLARYNSPQTVPPAFPELSALLAGSDSLVQGALRVNAVALAAICIFAAVGAASFVKDRWVAAAAAIGAAAIAAFSFPVFPSAYFFQPDLMTLAAITGIAAGASLFLRKQRFRWAVLFGAMLGICFSTREHGIILLLALLPAMALVLKKNHRLRLSFAFLLGLQIGGGTAAGEPLRPFFWPHGSPNGTIIKAEVAIRDSLALAGHGHQGQQLSGGLQRDNAASKPYLQSMREQAFSKGGEFMPLFASALIGLLAIGWKRGWRGVILMTAVLSPLAASLLVWTQWRHFFVLAGASVVIGVGGGAIIAEKWMPKIGALLLLIVCGNYTYGAFTGQSNSSYYELYRLLGDQQKKQHVVNVAKVVREIAEPGSVVTAHEEVAILAGLQPILLKPNALYAHKPPAWPSFTYRTYIVSRQSPGNLWQQVGESDSLKVFRMTRPENVEVRCLYGDWPGLIVERIPDDKQRLQPFAAPGCPSP